MKSRRKLLAAAAFSCLALTASTAHAGWYSLTPPVDPFKLVVDDAAAISRWLNRGSFDSARDCEDADQHEYEVTKRMEANMDRREQQDALKAKNGDKAAKERVDFRAKMHAEAEAQDPGHFECGLTYTGDQIDHDSGFVPRLCVTSDDPRLREGR